MRDEKIIIYGAGEYGKRLLHFLRSLGVEVDYFCQTEADAGMYVEEIPVVSFAALSKMEEPLQILIAMANKEVSRKIKMRLNGVFLEQADVRDCGPLLEKDHEDNCSPKGYCLLCSTPIESFCAGGFAEAEKIKVFREHHVIGGGWRATFQCPICGSIDRERWQLWVLSKYTGIFRDKCRVLHFAPEPHLSVFIAANPDCDYYTGDIVPGRAMHQTDIMDIQYKENTFDYVIMNHVLEHIPDMNIAMAEVKRVLKPDGKLVLSFPICADQDTLELPGVMTAAERLEKYGQEDHVRLFGRDYLERIKAFGLDVNTYSPKECCTQEEVARYGFIEDDVSIICTIAKQ